MTKSEFVSLLSRRLGVPVGHINSIIERLHAAGLVPPTKGSRRFPPEIDEHDAIAILIAVLSDRGLDAAADNTWTLAATHHDGTRFSDWLQLLIYGPPRHIGHLIVHGAGASAVVDGKHVEFGQRGTAPAKIFSGTAIMAIAAEIQGASPRDADAIAAIQGLL